MSDQDVPGSPKADWYADPMGRHQYRYWDGSTWTDSVADDGQSSVDPVYPVNAAKSLGTTRGSARIERLIVALKDPDDHVRQRTWQTLGKVRDPDDFGRLVVALNDPDHRVREGVTKALGLTRDPRAVEPLIAALKITNKDELVRWDAAEALGRICDPRAVEPLIAALNDSYDWVRFAAAHSLGQIGDPRAVEPLVARLKDVVDRVRWEAARALRKLGDPRGAKAHAALKEESKAQRLRDQPQDRGKTATQKTQKAGKPKTVGPKAGRKVACEMCSKEIRDYHYGFEHMVFGEWLGWQCSNCGRVFCVEHAPSTFRSSGDRCSCGGWVTTLEKGPAEPSFVAAARRDGKYGVHMRPPDDAVMQEPHSSDQSASAEIVVDRSPQAVWADFTESVQWKEWMGYGLTSAEWRPGGKLVTEDRGWGSADMWILELTPAESVRYQSSGGFTEDTTFLFESLDDGRSTRVTVQKNYAGVSFTDGGAGKRAELRATLLKFKSILEQ